MKKIKYILLITVMFVFGSMLLSCSQDSKTSSSSSPSLKLNSSSKLSPFSPIAKRILHETFILGEKDVSVYNVNPPGQSGFDNIKNKILPFLSLLLEKLKDLGVKNPKITLIISVNGSNAYESGITNEYVIK